jgi:hypothetical protein
MNAGTSRLLAPWQQVRCRSSEGPENARNRVPPGRSHHTGENGRSSLDVLVRTDGHSARSIPMDTECPKRWTHLGEAAPVKAGSVS